MTTLHRRPGARLRAPSLRALTRRLEELSLNETVAVLVLLEPALAAFDRQANLTLEQAPSGER